jgi:hypothetical protein
VITIHKYPLDIDDATSIEMPSNAVLLDCQVQRGTPCLWAMVDPSNPKETRWFRVIGTGHPIPDASEMTYFRSIQIRGGDLVFHVFEVK